MENTHIFDGRHHGSVNASSGGGFLSYSKYLVVDNFGVTSVCHFLPWPVDHFVYRKSLLRYIE